MSGPPDPRRPRRDIVVIGGSAGATRALQRLVRALPRDFPAVVLAVLHRAPVDVPRMAEMISANGQLPARDAVEGDVLEPGRLLVAPADRHLLVDLDVARVVRGPRESRSRPAIDPLFRSAAVSHKTRVVAVLLSGLLDDGTAGIGAVKRCGGVTVVQDPHDAEYPDMPRSALNYVDVDHVVTMDEMPALLTELVGSEAPPAADAPADLNAEVRASFDGTWIPAAEAAREPADAACPDCGGPLKMRHEGRLRHYRCHMGHTFSDRSLLQGQDAAIERSLWVALRSLEERARMLDSIADADLRADRPRSAAESQERAAESRDHAERIRKLLTESRF